MVLMLGLLSLAPLRAQNTWTAGGGTDTNWSTGVNWSYLLAPASYDTVLFGNAVPAAPGVPSGVVDNAVDGSAAIYSLQYQTVTTNGGGYHTTLIPGGISLNINGMGGDAIKVGTGVSQGSGQNVYSRFLGAGTLTVTNTTGDINVMQFGANNDHRASLDLSGLSNFVADVDQVLISTTTTSGEQYIMGTLFLAQTNYLHLAPVVTRPGLLVGSMDNGSTGRRGTQELWLGLDNTIHSDTIAVGGMKMDGTVRFRSGVTGGKVTLRGSGGGTDRVKLLGVGEHRAAPANYFPNGTSAAANGTLDTTGNLLDALVVDLYVGRSQTNNNGATTGTITYDQGTLDANNVYLGYHPSPAAATGNYNGTGTINVNGNAALTINNDLLLARKVGPTTPSGTLNVAASATASVKGDIVSGGGNATVTVNGALSVAGNISTNGGTSAWTVNGTLDLQPGGDPAAGTATFGTLAGAGSIRNASQVTVAGGITPGGVSSAATLNIANNLSLSSGALVNVNLASSPEGANDLVNVTGDLALNNNGITLVPLGDSLSGSYPLFKFTGTRSGTLDFTNTTRYAASVVYDDTAGAGQVSLAITGGGPASLKWASANNSAWDLASTNWLNGTTPDRFFPLDVVLVDDLGTATNLLLLSGPMYPAAVTVNSTSRDFFFGGSGRISGGASLAKQGPGMLTISNANDFIGPVTVSAGTLRLVNGSALGATNSGTTVASGATLDVFGQSIYNPGEVVTIAGSGVNNAGAVINTGANQNNAIRFLSLSDDATVRNDNRWDVRGPGGNSSFSGRLDLNGFTLTKLGGAQMSLADVVATNSGSIIVAGGMLGLTRSQVDGPGYIEGLTNIILFENSSTGFVNKAFSFAGPGGGTLRVTGNAVTLGVPITNAAGLTIDLSQTLTLTDSLYGPGPLTKISGSNLILNAPQAYTGPTTIAAGRLTVSTNGAISLTPSVAMASGTTLDVSAMPGGFTLGGSQTFSGFGTVLGDFTANPGANLVVGTTVPGTLVFSNNLTLNGATNTLSLGSDPAVIGDGVNSLIVVSNLLTLAGNNTLLLKPVAPLVTGTPYTIMVYSNALVGSAANLRVVSGNPRYTFTVVDPSGTPGAIQVTASGIPTTLVWKGGVAGSPNAWDTGTTPNWLNGSSADTFFAGDSVSFDDTATTANVNLAGSQQPGTVTVNNNSLAYNFGGTGSLLAGAMNKSGSGSLRIANDSANTFAAAVTLDGGAVTFVNNGSATFAQGLTMTTGTLTLQNSDNILSEPLVLNGGALIFDQTNDVTLGGIVRDDGISWGTVEKRNANILTLSGNNTNYDGPILVSSGTLKAGNSYALGNTNASTTVANGAALDVNGTSLYNPGEQVNISGAGVGGAGAIINTGGAVQNGVRAVVLNNHATVAAWTNRWDIRGPGGNGSLSGALVLNGFKLTKLGGGQISVVDADLTSPGNIDVFGGVLAFTRDNATGEGVVNLSTNIVLFENYTSGSFTKPLVSGGGIVRLAGNAFALDSAITNDAGVSLDTGGQTLTLNNTITGPGGVNKISTGTAIYSQNNDYAGGTVVTAGTLQVGNGAGGGAFGNIPPCPSGFITNNGTIAFNRYDDVVVNDQITGLGALQQIGNGATYLNRDLTIAGAISQSAGTLYVRGSFGTNGSITQTGGTMYLTASNSFSGQTYLNGSASTLSVVIISNSFALGSTDGNTRIRGDSGANCTLQLAGSITVPEPIQVDARQGNSASLPSIENIADTNTLTGQINGGMGGSQYNIQADYGTKLIVAGNFVPPSTAGTRVLKLMGDGVGEWSGIISNSASALVPALLTKTGSGIWTLSGANVYGGNTTISGGTLAVAATGSINNTPSIDVQAGTFFDVSAVAGYTLGAGQTLKGVGSVVGSVTSLGVVTPGEAAAELATLTFSNNLVLAGTTWMEINRNGGVLPLSDQIVAKALTLGGTLVVTNVVDPAVDPFALGDTFKLFDAPAIAGAFTGFVLPTLPDSSLGWNTSRLAVDGTIKVAIAPTIPTTPTNLTWVVSGNKLDISWPANYTGYSLEGQTNTLAVGLTGNWFLVPGSTTTNRMILDVDSSKGTVYYRLHYTAP